MNKRIKKVVQSATAPSFIHLEAMERLTETMLAAFIAYEKELCGEQIRRTIAAKKAKRPVR